MLQSAFDIESCYICYISYLQLVCVAITLTEQMHDSPQNYYERQNSLDSKQPQQNVFRSKLPISSRHRLQRKPTEYKFILLMLPSCILDANIRQVAIRLNGKNICMDIVVLSVTQFC